MMTRTDIAELQSRWSSTRVVVIGAARSGIGAAELLHSAGAAVFVSDNGPISDAGKQRLQTRGIAFEEGGHSAAASDGAFAVVSPGVPTHAPLVQGYLSEHKEVVSEIELASWFTESPIVAVTGSNGKTTVSSWIAHLFETAQLPYRLAGNIGMAFSEQVGREHGQDAVGSTRKKHYWVLEVSSFQLDHVHCFSPKVSVILNISADHMDRYNHSIDDYAQAKFRLTEHQGPEQIFIYNYDDTRVRAHAESLKKQTHAPQLWAFSTRETIEQGAYVHNDRIIFRFNNHEETLMPSYELGLQGQHNLQNGLATALAARACEIKNDNIRESLSQFTGVEHRLELVRTLDGVKYINDSKATNVNAVWFALDSIKTPMTLILGGRDKGNDYSELRDQLKEKVHTVIAIGESKARIQEALGEIVPHLLMADDMRSAVRMAQKQAKRGEVVLLSPACSSFDMFESYEHRGRVFKECVQHLS
jgi:UDP-N-acetylmuramoylalanine--D-glutamate ligase